MDVSPHASFSVSVPISHANTNQSNMHQMATFFFVTVRALTNKYKEF